MQRGRRLRRARRPAAPARVHRHRGALHAAKGDTASEKTGHSPCVIRAGFYTENLLLYAKQAQGEGKLKLPIGEDHKFAPVALGDIAQIAAYVVTSEGPQELADNVRGQVIVVTGAYPWLIVCSCGAD